MTPYAAVNGLPLGEGFLSIPRVGRAVAEARLAVDGNKTPLPEGSPAVLAFQDGTQWQMTCVYAGLDSGLWRVRLVGGKAKLAEKVRPKFYSGIAVTSVLHDILTEVGEEVGQIDAPGVFEHYVRIREEGYLALGSVLHAKFPAHYWRVNPAGAVDVLPTTWEAGPEVEVLDRIASQHYALLKPVPGLVPGLLLPNGWRIDRVRQDWGGEIRTGVFYE